jgi:hypothetical protein
MDEEVKPLNSDNRALYKFAKPPPLTSILLWDSWKNLNWWMMRLFPIQQESEENQWPPKTPNENSKRVNPSVLQRYLRESAKHTEGENKSIVHRSPREQQVLTTI